MTHSDSAFISFAFLTVFVMRFAWFAGEAIGRYFLNWSLEQWKVE